MLNFINGTIPVYVIRGTGHRQQVYRLLLPVSSQSYHPHPVNSGMVKRENRRRSCPMTNELLLSSLLN